jgi:HD-GYP domain-containing protein (c-di-GMP phosphodiesterase class II)
MHIAGLVHDVGKIGVPEQLLCKPGELTEIEYAAIREHPRIGYRILRDIPRFEDILDGVLYHHERWDGAGYPDGIAGEDIPLVARLIALADAFDAMCSTRTYRSAMNCDQVLAELSSSAGGQFDPTLVPLFLELDFTAYQRMVDGHQVAASQGMETPSLPEEPMA